MMSNNEPHRVERALILGCGYTGMALLRKLIQRGADVWATSRSDEQLSAIKEAGGHAVKWDAADAVPDEAVDTIFVLFPPGDLKPDDIAERVTKAKSRVVYCSSTTVYGMGRGQWMDETFQCRPATERGRTRLHAERAFVRRGAIAVRAVGIYGPERNIVARHRSGTLRLAANLERFVNLIHVDDLATTLLHAAERSAPGEAYIAADGKPVRWRHLAKLAAELTGLPLPPPEPLSSNTDARAMLSSSRRFSGGRIRDVLGVTLAYPSALEALREFDSD